MTLMGCMRAVAADLGSICLRRLMRRMDRMLELQGKMVRMLEVQGQMEATVDMSSFRSFRHSRECGRGNLDSCHYCLPHRSTRLGVDGMHSLVILCWAPSPRQPMACLRLDLASQSFRPCTGNRIWVARTDSIADFHEPHMTSSLWLRGAILISRRNILAHFSTVWRSLCLKHIPRQ